MNQPHRVLLVDDEEMILKSLARILRQEEYEVVTASSARKALDLLRENEFCVIVSDMRMPEMDGVALLREAMNIQPSTVRLVLSAYADASLVMAAVNEGNIWQYLTKPWREDEFKLTIRNALKMWAMGQENRQLGDQVRQQNLQLRQWNDRLEMRVAEQTAELRSQKAAVETLNQELRRNFTDAILAFSQLLEIRNPNIGSHSRRVAEITRRAAVALRLPPEDISVMAVAGLLHDIGKVGLSDELLERDLFGMTTLEWKEYRMHPVRGQTVLNTVDDLRGAGLLVRHHHEHFDGQGYPDQLQGTDIPLGARIIAFADFIDRTLVRLHSMRDVVPLAFRSINRESGCALDSGLYPLLPNLVQDAYDDWFAVREQEEIELPVKELVEGMVLSRDLTSGTGVLLLGKGTVLTGQGIDLVRRLSRTDPFSGGVSIWLQAFEQEKKRR